MVHSSWQPKKSKLQLITFKLKVVEDRAACSYGIWSKGEASHRLEIRKRHPDHYYLECDLYSIFNCLKKGGATYNPGNTVTFASRQLTFASR